MNVAAAAIGALAIGALAIGRGRDGGSGACGIDTGAGNPIGNEASAWKLAVGAKYDVWINNKKRINSLNWNN